MADTIGYITFTNVSMTDNSGHATGTFSQTTLQIDYTTEAVTVVGGGSLTFAVSSGAVITFPSSGTTFTLTASGSTYTLTANGTQSPVGGGVPNLSLAWTGQSPQSFDSGKVNVSGGSNFTKFTNNAITPSVCFAAGTVIRTPAGDIPVETLKAGDLVLTASGDLRRVKWIGHRHVDFRETPGANPGRPIRVSADAFGPGRPSQDLFLSAGHAICVDVIGEVLIPVGHLINGSTIAEVDVEEITYWHVELDSHDLLVANSLPAESYLAMGNRGGFEELQDALEALEDGRERTYTDFCRPVVTEGPTLNCVRDRLAARAAAMGWMASHDPDLRLTVDGRILPPLAGPGAALFLFPAGARDVRLISNTFVPKALGRSDERRLGLLLTGISFCGSVGEPRRISLDDERLREGVYGVEEYAGVRWRWTNGELILSPQLWAGLEGSVSVLVSHVSDCDRKWNSPQEPRSRQIAERPRLAAVCQA